MGETSIQWTDETWNPLSGCTRVSPGCENCYAERIAHRFRDVAKSPLCALTTDRGRWNGIVRLNEHKLADPLRWRTGRKIFVNSMSDLFHESVAFETIAAIFGVMACAPQHTHQVLTKRPAQLFEFFMWLESKCMDTGEPPDLVVQRYAYRRLREIDERAARKLLHPIKGCHRTWPWPLPWVWLGVSVENQKAADERIPELLKTPASVRFLSVEPMLEPINLRGHLMSGERPADCICGHGHGFTRCPNYGGVSDSCHHQNCRCPGFTKRRVGATGIHWVIGGGESGPRARPYEIAWARSVRDECSAAGVAYFQKQLGRFPLQPDLPHDGLIGPAVIARQRELDAEWPEGTRFGNPTGLQALNGRVACLKDSHGGDMTEWPADLRVREFPR